MPFDRARRDGWASQPTGRVHLRTPRSGQLPGTRMGPHTLAIEDESLSDETIHLQHPFSKG